MSMLVILIILLVVLGGGGFYAGGPRVGGGLFGIILLIILIMALTGRLEYHKGAAENAAQGCASVSRLRRGSYLVSLSCLCFRSICVPHALDSCAGATDAAALDDLA